LSYDNSDTVVCSSVVSRHQSVSLDRKQLVPTSNFVFHPTMAPKNPLDDDDDNNNMTSPQPTLREQAALRAEADTPKHETFPFPATPHTPQAHPLAFSSVTPESLAQSARKEWRQHGTALTQSLEEQRRLDEERPGTLTVRVLSADTRRDVSGAKYTAYILRVQLATGQVLELEHRYSEFAKLNDNFKSHNIQLEYVPFPSKHWAGRMGNWTPSLKWAPSSHGDLIHYRKIQLDVWLVHVVGKYNLGDLPHSVHTSVYHFLTQSDQAPCDQDNPIAEKDALRWNNPLSFTLGSTIRQATATVEHMCYHDASLNDTDQSIPLDLLQGAKGLCFLTVLKGGLVVSGRVGTGLLVARLEENRWSAPCALGTVGMGWGMLAGGDITHYLVVLTTTEAVDALLGGTVQLGAELGVAVGPVGRGATSQVSAGGDWAVHPAYSYAHSQGLFLGMSLEGSVLTTRTDVNAKFYGQHLPTTQILDLPPPKAAEPLYQALGKALAMEIPEDGFRPSQLFQEKRYPPPKRPSPTSPVQPAVDPVGRVAVPTVGYDVVSPI
jgi:lipid-binding SYLF domain-containing protein